MFNVGCHFKIELWVVASRPKIGVTKNTIMEHFRAAFFLNCKIKKKSEKIYYFRANECLAVS